MRQNIKKFVAGLAMLAVLTPYVPAYASSGHKIIIDGSEATLENPVVFSDGYNFAPMSEIMSLLGAEVKWNANTKTVTATRGENEITVEIGAEEAVANGEKVPIEPPARIIDGLTYVPVGFIARSLGYSVEWSAETKTVSLMTPNTESERLDLNYKPRYDRNLTYDEACERATSQSNSLKDLAASMSDLQEQRDELSSSYYYTIVGISMDTMPSYMVGDTLRPLISKLTTMEASLMTEPYTKEMTEGAIAASVMGSFLSIKSRESAIALTEGGIELSKRNLDNLKLMNELGMSSDSDYESAKAAHEKLVEELRENERALEKEYNALNKLLGYDAPTRYNVVLDEEYTPLAKDFRLENYITTDVGASPSVKLAEITLSQAESNVKLFSGDTQSSYNEALRSVEKASRDLADTKKTLENSIRTQYSNLRDIETSIATNELDLKTLKTAAETAKVKYEIGENTELQVLQAMYDVDSKEKSIELLKQQYNFEKFRFFNSYTL